MNYFFTTITIACMWVGRCKKQIFWAAMKRDLLGWSKWAGATANEEKLLFDGDICRLPLHC